MRILVLAPYVPFPVRTGGQGRTLGLVTCLAAFADVHVLAIGDPAAAELPVAREHLAGLGAGLELHAATGPGQPEADAADIARLPDAAAHFRSPSLACALAARESAWWPDIVHVEEVVMAQYDVRGTAVLDRQKVEWAYHEALAGASGPEGGWHQREAARFRRWDAALAGRFAAVLAASEEDRRLLAPLHGAVRVVPHGVDDRIRRPADRTTDVREVLLYGALDYPPNALAHAFYFREVWPRLREATDLRTVVVGSGAPPPSIPRNDSRVDLRGFVGDVTGVLTAPAVLVAPLQVGGGARTKVLEALAAGLPVVSTAVGVEGLGLEPGRHYLRVETAAETVAAVLHLVSAPERVAALGREGAARVDQAFRWDVIARGLEPIYRALAPPRRRADGSRRALLVGVHPLPGDATCRSLSFPGHRTAQLASALAAAGCEVEAVLLDEEGDRGAGSAGPPRRHVLAHEAFRAGVALQERHDAFEPDLVVAAGGFHAARVVSSLRTRAPRWIDLPGDLASEGQLRASRGGDGALRDALAVLARALAVGDHFSVVGPTQRLALLGQLGTAGRLTGPTVGREPVAVIPVSCEGPPRPPPMPPTGFTVLWAGGYNTWMDDQLLLVALEQAMARNPEVAFVSTGGPVPGHEEGRHAAFWARARASPFGPRFHDRGRVSRQDALAALGACHVVVCPSRGCLEAELGSRLRLVEALAYGRPVVATACGDLAGAIATRGAGLVAPPGDAVAFGAGLVRLMEDRDLRAACARAARALWEAAGAPEASARPLRDWALYPRHWPVSVLDDSPGVEAERVKLQAELDHVRASRTFRALRLLDRLLGRSGRGR